MPYNDIPQMARQQHQQHQQQQQQPILRNGAAANIAHKHRTSDDIPDYASQYIPTFPTLHPQASSSARYQQQQEPYPSFSRQDEQPVWEPYWTQAKIEAWRHMRAAEAGVRQFRLRDLWDWRLGLIAVWAVALWLGEERSFAGKVEGCKWGDWEQWPQHANPHHLVLIADPQLVDPHTYPGRPWPLSTLTMRYTDMYMRKSFRRIRDVLVPDSVMFLGDLFDGGREWGNDPNDSVRSEELVSSDREWRRYGQDYWLKEYRRFGRIYFDTWLRNIAPPRYGQRGKRFIASLPGNHDLGLGNGIRLPARQRFSAFFGDENRIDIIGNHSFVSLDTVSLSAKGQPNTDTGTQGMRDDEQSKPIWEPADQFLHEARARKARAIDRELRVQNGRAEHEPMDSKVWEVNDARSHTIEQQPHLDTDVPSIILTHVPLYRAPGTPCGPLRERYPPAQKPNADGEYIEKDDPNSIHVAAGIQYQNVLTPSISNEIIDLVGDVSHVFSGDDHDYCELVHREYTSRGGGIREITVKSTSWAMGVRHPGFLLISLWNPIDSKGKNINSGMAKTGTIQTHLCLLPDQLTIFIRYAILLILTLFVLTLRAFRVVRSENIARKEDTCSHLPTTRLDSDIPLQTLHQASDSTRARSTTATTHSSSNSSSAASDHFNHASHNGSLNARSAASTNRPRSISPGYNLPADEAKSLPLLRHEDRNNIDLNSVGISTSTEKGPRWRAEKGGLVAVGREVYKSVLLVGTVVSSWYLWLIWHS